MNKSESIKYFDKLNKVINGSQKIIEAIDNSSTINPEKAIKASMLNSILLAECLKEILKDIVIDDYEYSNSKKDNAGLDDLMNIFGIKK
jgi:ribosomal protein S26